MKYENAPGRKKNRERADFPEKCFQQKIFIVYLSICMPNIIKGYAAHQKIVILNYWSPIFEKSLIIHNLV